MRNKAIVNFINSRFVQESKYSGIFLCTKHMNTQKTQLFKIIASGDLVSGFYFSISGILTLDKT